MIHIVPKEDCVGCYACHSVCMKGAITMLPDVEGFEYPHVDESACSNCKSCISVCPAINENKYIRLKKPLVYASWSKDPNVRLTSSSGGVFTAFSKRVLKGNGIIFGAAFDKDLRLNHDFVDDIRGLKKLTGSKYLQSSLCGIYKKVKKNLDENREVLFVGTPCQVAGMNSYLGKDDDNLITCDLICHGVASPGVFHRYVNQLEKKHDARIIDVQFRRKEQGWKNFHVVIRFANGHELTEPFFENSYMRGFLADLYLRESCYQCKYSRLPRVADITLGDFWGIWNYGKEFLDDKGVSAVLINSRKGKSFMDFVDGLDIREAALDWVIKGNKALIDSVGKPKNRKKFFELYRDKETSLENILKKCLPKTSYLDKVIWSLRRRIHKWKE